MGEMSEYCQDQDIKWPRRLKERQRKGMTSKELDLVRKGIKASIKKTETPVKAKPAAAIMKSLLPAVTEMYSKDHTVPGLVVAWLPEDKVFYASIARYTDGMKEVVASERGKTLDQAVSRLAKTWSHDTKHQRALASIVRGI